MEGCGASYNDGHDHGGRGDRGARGTAAMAAAAAEISAVDTSLLLIEFKCLSRVADRHGTRLLFFVFCFSKNAKC
jgi:hypothetical protein